MTKLRSIHFAKRMAEDVFYMPSRRDAVRFLTRQGFKVLGRGSFATVVCHPDHPEVVIKLASDISHRFSYWRDGFSTYVHWLQAARSRSKFAPRIYHFLDDPRHSVTVMERLYRVEDRKTRRRVRRTGDMIIGSVNESGGDVFAPTSAFRKFVDRFRRLGHLDLHGANVMRRLNGDLVISDPLIHAC
jgi:hypothetical protein